MKGEFSNKEAQEIKPPGQGNWKDIKPVTNMSGQEVNEYWNNEFKNASETQISDSEEKIGFKDADNNGIKEEIEQNESTSAEENLQISESDLENVKNDIEVSSSDTEGKLSINVKDIKKIENEQKVNPDDSREVRDYYTKKEKMDFAGHSAGKWDGEVGNSEFHPDDSGARKNLEKYGQRGIEYRNGNPDFSKVCEATVKIENMTSNRPLNFRQAYKKIAEKWSNELKDGRTNWTSRDVKNWKKENHYDLHECADMKTMNLVPHDIHMACKHIGGVAECKLAENKEVKYDE